MPTVHNWKIILTILICNVALMSASYTMLVPFLPIYLMKELGVSQQDVNIWNGAVFSVSFLVGAIMAPIWGKLADKKGRKLMAVRSSLCISAAYFLSGIVTTPEQMFLVRAFQGFASGLMAAELAIISASVPKEKLGFSIGAMQAGGTGGSVIGPLLGGVLAETLGMRESFFVAGTALFLVSVFLILFIPEPPREKNADSQKAENISELSLLKTPLIRQMLFLAVCTQMVILILQPILTLYIAELQNSMNNIIFISGVVFSLSGISSSIAAPIWGNIGQRKSFGKIMYLTMWGTGSCLLLQSLAYNLTTFAIMQIFFGLFYSAITPSISSVLATNTDNSVRGSIFGMLFSAQQLGSMLGPLVGAAVSTLLGLKEVIVCAGIIMLIVGVYVKTTRKDIY